MSAPVGPREEQSYLLVLISGLATTALTLVGVYVLDANTDFHIMGWYANYILPIGAVIVGVAASSGYGLASWFSGIKITRSLLWIVLVLQLAAYFATQYIGFKSLHLVHRKNGTPVGFVEYFDATARSFAWKQDNGSAGAPGVGLRFSRTGNHWVCRWRLDRAGAVAQETLLPGMSAIHADPAARLGADQRAGEEG